MVCKDNENCGSGYPHGSDRCRDAFCQTCELGSCESLEEAQACCDLSPDCTAVYGGGYHWWTFHDTCEVSSHENNYQTWQKGATAPTPAPPPPTPAPPTPAPPTPPGNPNFPAPPTPPG